MREKTVDEQLTALRELREAAKRAAPRWVEYLPGSQLSDPDDVAYVKAASPSVILRLLDQSMPRINGMDTAPKDGSYVLLFGPSGCTTTPLRCHVARHDREYRPRQPWVTHSNDSFEDDGGPPCGWLPLPPETDEDLTRLLGAGVIKRDDGWWFALDDRLYGPYASDSLASHERDTRRALRDSRR